MKVVVPGDRRYKEMEGGGGGGEVEAGGWLAG